MPDAFGKAEGLGFGSIDHDEGQHEQIAGSSAISAPLALDKSVRTPFDRRHKEMGG